MQRFIFIFLLMASALCLRAQLLGSSLDQVASYSYPNMLAAQKDMGHYSFLILKQIEEEYPDWKASFLELSDAEYGVLSVVESFLLVSGNGRVDSTELLAADTVVKVMFNDERMAAFELYTKRYKLFIINKLKELESQISLAGVKEDSFLVERLEYCLPFRQFPNREYFRRLNLTEARLLIASMFLGVRQMRLIFAERLRLKITNHQQENPLKVEKSGIAIQGKPYTLVFSLEMSTVPDKFTIKLSNGKTLKAENGKATYTITPEKTGRMELEASVNLHIDGVLRSFTKSFSFMVI